MISVNLTSCLKRGFYPVEYMDEWEKFVETTLPRSFAAT